MINVYRQFLISANLNADLNGFKKEILRAMSRVFGGVSAIIDFEIMGMNHAAYFFTYRSYDMVLMS